MKRLSVRKKLTLWMTALMLALVIVVLGFLFAVSSRVAMQSAQEQLESFVRGNLTSITMENDTLQFGEGFQFTRSGMYLLVYNASGALLAGQTPLSYPTSVPFENGLTRLVSDDQADDVYLTLDFWLPFGWDDGVWVRGVMQEPEVSDAMHRLLDISLLLLPLIVLVGGVGVYRIVRRAFQPIDRIVAAASRISEGRDLSQRIGLPPGKDEISQLAAAFDQMFERLERAFEAESRFTSDASHELRTPTAVILAQCREAEQHAKTLSDYAEAVEVIHRQADRMSGLIGQLLQMTRLEQGTVPLCLEEANLGDLAEVVCEEQRAVHPECTIETWLEPGVTAWFDVTLITRALQNLLENAYRYGGPRITVEVRCEREDVALSVFDDGPGIPEDQQQRIWKRFYRVETARSGGQGTGLGLPMVAQIASMHGGEASVESRPGWGTRFTLRFPAVPADQKPAAEKD